MTVFAFVLILIILIPVLAIVIDSPVGQALARRISGGLEEGDGSLAPRIEAIESELRYLSESVESLQEESKFLHSLIEGKGAESPRLEPPAETPGPGSGA